MSLSTLCYYVSFLKQDKPYHLVFCKNETFDLHKNVTYTIQRSQCLLLHISLLYEPSQH